MAMNPKANCVSSNHSSRTFYSVTQRTQLLLGCEKEGREVMKRDFDHGVRGHKENNKDLYLVLEVLEVGVLQ